MKSERIFFLFFLIVVPLIFTIAYLSVVYKSPYVIISEQDGLRKDFSWSTYTDKLHQGTSEITKNKSRNFFEYQYQLKQGYKFKFALISLEPSRSEKFDLSCYNQVNIEMKASRGKGILFYLYSFFPEYEKYKLANKSRPHQYILKADTTFRQLSILMDDLYTPEWWYMEANETKATLPEPSFRQAMAISLGNCVYIKTGEPDIVTLKSLTFSVNLWPYFLKILPYFSVYYFVVGLCYFFYTRRNQNIVLLENAPSLVVENSNHEQAVLDVIGINYFEPDYSIEDLSKEVGLAETEIVQILKAKTGMSFRQLVNNIRINEAERLLAETDLPVNEVAQKVGFNTIAHFNRVFKSKTGFSPLTVRNKQVVK